MRRREFIRLLGGAAAAWPLVARAQQDDRVRRVGYLSTLTESDLEFQSWNKEWVQHLQELGWTNGRNVLPASPISSSRLGGSGCSCLRNARPVLTKLRCPPREWRKAENQFAIMFEERFVKA
jgi:hypothetical protein